MRPEATEWVKKAEADFLSMSREMNAAQDLNYDLVCFLAQQSSRNISRRSCVKTQCHSQRRMT
jgi:hypothetical protein